VDGAPRLTQLGGPVTLVSSPRAEPGRRAAVPPWALAQVELLLVLLSFTVTLRPMLLVVRPRHGVLRPIAVLLAAQHLLLLHDGIPLP